MLPRILMISSEASPWAKTGGLADVVGSLPLELARIGHPAAVVIPGYGNAREAPGERVLTDVPIPAAGRLFAVSVRALTQSGVTTFFVDQPDLYDRPGLYGDRNGDYPDNHLRFAVLCRAALEISRRLFPADILHCHDWQASLLPAWIRGRTVADPHFLGAKTLLTIHNLGYQGVFDPSVMSEIGLSRALFHAEGFEFWGKISFLKAGIVYADVLTTVSPTYAREIQTPEYGFGLDGLLRRRKDELTGILNGVDCNLWNPETDGHLPAWYSAHDLSGKQICKRELLREMGFPESRVDHPLIGIVSRFTSQKGFDLLAQAAEALFASNSKIGDSELSLIALGSGEPEWEDLFRNLAASYPDRVRVRFGYDEGLAHRIEAGADIFLMPSRYEPCGLNQIYSLRYGTVPVVRATGGLEDSVDSSQETGTGFKFHDYNGKALLDAVHAACARWQDRSAWKAMMARGMRKDFSWAVSAAAYSRLYRGLHPAGTQATLTI